LIAIVGIQDPLREGVLEAIVKCQRAGVTVKMCAGDNVFTARSIATQCGIYTAGGIIMEGPIFRQLSDHDMQEVVLRLQVLARSSPEDKKIVVEKLKEMGQVVGVTGDGANDGPASKTADVGFSMGIAGTEIAKEAFDIILMDENFASIVKAIARGRCVNHCVRKFLQFQVATNVTAVVITSISALATSHGSTQLDAVMTAVQFLWINIFMNTFAALALATDPASEILSDRKPDKKTAALFPWTCTSKFCSSPQIRSSSFSYSTSWASKYRRKIWSRSLALWCSIRSIRSCLHRIFISIHCRRLDKKLNIFEGLGSSPYFVIITLIGA
jgi:Ca2+-transporting ATPase